MSGSKIEIKQDISPSVAANIDYIRSQIGYSMDVTIKELLLANGQPAALVHLDGLVDKLLLGRGVIAPLLQADKVGPFTMAEAATRIIRVSSDKIETDMAKLVAGVLQGLVALFLEGSQSAVLIELIQWPQRSVAEPATDVVMRGPREGFIEGLRSNVALLRRKIHHPDFQVEMLRLGRYTQTDIALVYVGSIVSRDVLAELKGRLQRIDVDAILDSGYIEQYIQDTPYSLFPTVGTAEKPDLAAARVLEGRVALLVDGSPIVLTVPMLFVEGLQNPDDYYTRFYYAAWLRIIRTIAFFISILLPGFFVAATSYHQQLIPFRLLISIAVEESQTPFSVGMSLLLIGLSFEILREAGIRLPKPAGQAISIVGALVMGQAAVSAGLISAAVLIVLALTAVASFVTVPFVDVSTITRLIFLALGWFMGFFGLMLGLVFLLMYLCSLETFGVPYFSPFAPLNFQGLKDSVIRFPLWKLKFRPVQLSPNRRRMSDWHNSGGDDES
ncbi:MAG: spore germination protein [Clostridia bacterium]|nr:spore germination protein [Clostridia bacterium]